MRKIPDAASGRRRPSLERWAKRLAVLWLVGAALIVAASVMLLDRMEAGARTTYAVEIPYLLNRNRNAIKIERLSSFVRGLADARDAGAERRLLLQIQTLSQSFVFDGDARLAREASAVAASARRIAALHGRERVQAASQSAPQPLASPQGAEGAQARDLADDALQRLDALGDSLTTDAALKADQMAKAMIASTARIRVALCGALAVLVALGGALVWICQKHILRPISAAVRGLQLIRVEDAGAVDLPDAFFSELDMIARAVEDYAGFAGELRAANTALRDLSTRDGLTGLANRRSLDAMLTAAHQHAMATGGDLALLLIDIDHFKALNDRFGHLVGDRCLRQVATALEASCLDGSARVARFGGEEFAVVLPQVAVAQAADFAESLRVTVGDLLIHDGNGQRIRVTVSVGATDAKSVGSATCEAMIEAADQALYEAKRSGRDRVSCFGSGPFVTTAALGAAA